MASSRIYDIAFRLNGKLNKNYNTTFAKAEAIAERTTGRIRNTVLSLGSMVISTAAIKDFVDTYKEFQQEMANTAAVGDIELGSERYEKLEKAALSAGKATTKTATESAAALGYMAQAGWSDEKSAKFLMPVLRLSEAAGESLEKISGLVTDSTAAYSIAEGGIKQYLDTVAKGANVSNASIVDMLEGYAEAGGTFKMFNAGFAEGGALLGALANRAIKGSEGGHKLQSLMLNFIKPSTRGQAMKAMDALNMKVYDGNNKFIGMIETIELLNKKIKGLSEEDRNKYVSMIAGKENITTLNNLLSAVNNVDSNGINELRQLENELGNSSGTVDRMAAIQNSALESRLKLLKSAWDDFKINVVSQAEPVMSELVSDLAERLPDITEKTMQFFNKSGKFIGKLWDKGKSLFNWASRNKNTLATVFAGIGSAIATYKVVSGVVGLAEGLAAIAGVIIANPVVATLVAVGGAIGAIAYSVHRANKELGKESLAKHFGDISLSLSDVESLSKSIFNQSEKWKDFADSLELAGEKYESFVEMGREIEKYNYKVSIGVALSEGEISDYKNDIEAYIDNAQSFIDQKQYAVSVGVDLLYGKDSAISNSIDKYYTDVNTEFSKLGTELSELVNSAFSDNILGDKEAQKIAAKMQEIQDFVNSINNSKTEAKFEAAALRYSSTELTSESYKQMVIEMREIAEESNANAETAYTETVGTLDAMWKKQESSGGSFSYFESYDDYMAQRKQADTDYLNALAENTGKVNEYVKNTLMDTYGVDMAKALGKADGKIRPIINKLMDKEYLEYEAFRNHTSVESEAGALITKIKQANMFGNLGIDKETKNAFKEIYNSADLESMIAEAERFKKAGAAIPDSMMEGIKMQISSGIIAGDINALYAHIYGEIYGYENLAKVDFTKWGAGIPQYIAAGCESGASGAASRIVSATNSMLAMVQYSLNNNPLIIKYSTQLPKGVQGPVQGKIVGIKGFASGTNYTPDTFIAGEKGPELITNSRGYRVYDALATGKMYDSAARLWELNENNIENRNVPVRGRINAENTSSSTEYNFNFTMPSITINGNVSDETTNQFKAMLEQYKAEVERAVMQKIRDENDRKRRVSNE